MTVNFLDNQSINARELNKVATDLNVTFNHFVDGTPYAVTELNKITQSILTAGVLTTGGQCKVTNGFIADGIIVFASGAKGTITTAEAYEKPTGAHYVFAIYSEDTNTAMIDTASSLPSGDVVPLAYVDANGVINDRRKFASAKVGTPSGANELSVDMSIRYNSASETDCGEYEIGFQPKFVMFEYGSSLRTQRLTTGRKVSMSTYADGSTGVLVYFELDGTKVKVSAKHTGTTGTTTRTFTFIFV